MAEYILNNDFADLLEKKTNEQPKLMHVQGIDLMHSNSFSDQEKDRGIQMA